MLFCESNFFLMILGLFYHSSGFCEFSKYFGSIPLYDLKRLFLIPLGGSKVIFILLFKIEGGKIEEGIVVSQILNSS